MAVWPPKLVSVTLYSSLTLTLSSTALTALSSRVRGVGQWKVKEGKKPFPLPGWNRGRRCGGSGGSRGASGSLPDATLSFLQRRKCLEDSSPSPTLTPNMSGEASPANNTGRRVLGPNCMLTERWDEAGLNRERR